MSRRFEKLIRDGIPDLAAREGRTLPVRAAAAAEWPMLLARKLVEESAEIHAAMDAGDRDALLGELADLQTVIESVAARAGIARAEIDAAATAKRAARGGFERGLVLDERVPPSARLHAGHGESLVDALRAELARCQEACLAVSFILASGLDLIEGALRAALLRGATIRLLTTDYLDVTEPQALQRLLAMPGRFDLRVYSHPARSFHPKAYLFDRGAGAGRAFVGSANLSRSGLAAGVEWTWSIEDTDRGHPMAELFGRFAELFDSPHAQLVTPTWIDAYALRRRPRSEADASQQVPDGPSPRPAQQLALRELERLRADGQRRALVIAATGLGKTWLAAFDARPFARVLFIAHRRELLQQAEHAFRAARPGDSVGYVLGDRLEFDRDLVFASVQTLSRGAVLDDDAHRTMLASFDYVVVDEFHHAAADSYLKVFASLSPAFLLGLTATPYRGDNRDLYALCDGNVAYEIRLFEAIAFGWLAPFRYLGVADPVDYDRSLLNASGSAYDAAKLSALYAAAARTELVIAQFRAHAGRAALGFCVSIAHAEAMAEAFEAAGIAARAVHSGLDAHARAQALAQLENGTLRILFTVDLFNEGVDIPYLDLVMFLRPTESMTVFLQQLGRGLRLHPGKMRLTVVDLIGNHRKAQFKLPFLLGLKDDGPDAPRKAFDGVRRLVAGERPSTLPDGVEVQLEERALAHLEQALHAGDGLRVLLKQAFAELTTALGRRPTLLELECRGRYAPELYRRQFGRSWYRVLDAMGHLSADEAALEAQCGAFLAELERTAMTRSFKMVVLKAMLEHRSLPGAIRLDDLVAYFRRHFEAERHRADIADTELADVAHVAGDVIARYIAKNPINAWVGGKTREASRFFAWDPAGSLFRYVGPRPEQVDAFLAAVTERVDWRLQRYAQRPGPACNLYKVIPTGQGGGACIMLGNASGDGMPRGEGWQLVRINGRYRYAKFAKVAINVMRDAPSDARGAGNLLVTELQALFGDDRLLDFARVYRVRIARLPGEACWAIEAA
ncbi:MAG TPA: DEAD/DEAH box helicase family protein [Quisquiliibacterium sp.]|nr:DEAD/DEAH box helicase family protein [Quisquiliibacterium sp.]